MTVSQFGVKCGDPTSRQVAVHIQKENTKIYNFLVMESCAAALAPAPAPAPIFEASSLCRRLNMSHLLILICVIVFQLFVGSSQQQKQL